MHELSQDFTEREITAKQRRFCEEYLIDLNATQAAIRAGYSARTAKAIASENLTKPYIAAEIAAAFAARSERTEVTQDRVIEELALIAFAPGINERLKQLRLSDQLAALDKLAKHLGMFTEHHHYTGEVTTSVRDLSDEELINRATQLANRLGLAPPASNGEGPSA